MTKQKLLEKLDAVVEEFAQSQRWGQVQINFQHGEPVMFQKSFTERLEERNSHEHRTR